MTIDPLVTPVLSEAQQKVWHGVQKVGVYWGFAGMLGGFANDGDGLEVELGGPARAGENNNMMNMPIPMLVPAARGRVAKFEAAPAAEKPAPSDVQKKP